MSQVTPGKRAVGSEAHFKSRGTSDLSPTGNRFVRSADPSDESHLSLSSEHMGLATHLSPKLRGAGGAGRRGAPAGRWCSLPCSVLRVRSAWSIPGPPEYPQGLFSREELLC